MNAAGMTFVLTGVYSVLQMPFYQSIVTNGSVSQSEFDGTAKDLNSIITTLKNTPGDKIEAMVEQYNNELTNHLNNFNSGWGSDLLAAFREAQTMVGFVTSVMAKSGISD
ncbi:MAG: hypothetical protein WA584_13060 [Pyrinomonadaceae bacterium]